MVTKIFNLKTTDFLFEHSILRDEKEVLRMAHSHNAYEIIFFLRGDATYIIEDRKYDLKKNDIVFIRPGKYHYIQLNSSAEYERYNMLFTSRILNLNLKKLIPNEVEVLNCSDNVIQQNFKKLNSYYSQFDEASFFDITKCLLKEILYNVSIYGKDSSSPSIVSPLISQALEYIQTNLFTIESITEISQQLFITETYLFKLFKSQLKLSPHKYIIEKRLLKAEKLIRSGSKPTEVYSACGFKNYSTFYKRYVEFFGFSPSDTNQNYILKSSPFD